MSELDELYQEVILDHNKSPRNFREIVDANRRSEGYNPLCGDHVTVYVNLADGVIRDISFKGSGCAISKASASMMTTELKGKSEAEAEKGGRLALARATPALARQRGNLRFPLWPPSLRAYALPRRHVSRPRSAATASAAAHPSPPIAGRSPGLS